ncbi:MAG: hypothetical protein A2V74_11525 [Acidobacteria bacterium RBG_16_70_10]|nr:MAG: hypothetical protein A2V74_11525 [Acidobacteria bacterium RBG_16_70_10]
MIRSPLKVVSGFPRPVRVLLVGTLVNKVGTFIIPYLTLVLLRDFRLDETRAARLLLAYGAGSLVSILVGGVLADRLGRRRTLLVSLLGGGSLALAMGLAPSLSVFVPLLVAFGFLADLYRPAASAVISDLLDSSQRASGYAGLRTAVNLGWATGTALGGLLADWSWRLLFLGDGLTTLAYGVLVWLEIPETRTKPHGGARGTTTGGAHVNPLRDGIYLQTVAVTFAFTLIFCSHLSVMPLTVTQAAGYPAVVYGLLAATNGVIIALFEISIVERLKGFRRLRLAAVGLALVGLGFGAIGLRMHWVSFLLAVLILTAGEILSAPQQMAFVADWAPPEARGRYLSLYQATWSVAFAVNPALFLPLHKALGEARFWAIMPLIAMPGVLVLLRLDRTADRPERLRGLTKAPPPAPDLLPAITPEG